MEILVGREAHDEFDILVPQRFNMVGRKHATIIIDDSSFSIKDHSKRGTFVNNDKIKYKNLIAGDKVILGDRSKGFIVNIEDVIGIYNKEKQKNRTDYTKEFQDLKKVYEAYENEFKKAIGKVQMKSAYPKIILTLLLMGVLVSPMGNLIAPNLRYPLMMGVGIIGTLFSVKSNTNIKLQKAKEQVKFKYTKQYICPKCRKKLLIDKRSWESLKYDGSCPNPKCNAIFSK